MAFFYLAIINYFYYFIYFFIIILQIGKVGKFSLAQE